jgi:sugar lactone lactonase YvrE
VRATRNAGNGVNKFNNPNGIFVDTAGKIYIADTGNNRIVRMDDMAGTSWSTIDTTRSGVKSV